MIRKPIVVKDCFFCKEKKKPNFLEYEVLGKFTSERGRILPKSRTGLCSKDQRRLTREIKRARYLALLPYIERAE